MKLYQGNHAALTTIKFCQDNNIGILLCSAWRNPSRFPYYALDNGAFGAFKNHKPWDAERFLVLLDRCLRHEKKPDFVIVPDIVGGGLDSLKHSLAWRKVLPAGTNYYLAVQEGMDNFEVELALVHFDGLFVGGASMDWKIKTAPKWIELARRHGKPCHIGRIGPWGRIMWAERIGAASIDSTSWPHNDSWHHIEYARNTERLNITV